MRETKKSIMDALQANLMSTAEADWKAVIAGLKACAKIQNEKIAVHRALTPVEVQDIEFELGKGRDVDGRAHTIVMSDVIPTARRFVVEQAKIKATCTKDEYKIFHTWVRQIIPNCYSLRIITWPEGTHIIILDRPSVVRFTTVTGRPVLHYPEGPALAWGRGNGPRAEKYFWEGLELPAHWYTLPRTPENLKQLASEVLTASNMELRRSGAELIGWIHILDSLNMVVIDEHPDPKFGRLVEVDLPGLPRRWRANEPAEVTKQRFLVAQCGTGRQIAVVVDPTATTALEAGARSYNVPVELYAKMGVRT